NSLPEFETFCFDVEEISSVSTTTHSDISLPEYDVFCDDHEFVDELAHIISPPKYDCFCFKDLPDPGELMSMLNSGIRENLFSTTLVNLPIEDDYYPLLTYVVWIFVAYLTYPVIPPYLHPFGNEDTIFDPGITIYHFSRLSLVKEKHEKDKIGSKPNKNGKRDEAGKSLKLLQWIKEEKPKKTKKEWPKTHTRIKSYSTLKERRKERAIFANSSKVQPQGPKLTTDESCGARDDAIRLITMRD
nr:hypothetical protein [Tanacetum cinerariifolium]